VTTGRTARVARYAPGETIRIRVREENAHESYLRVALDLDGDEFALRAQFPGGAETQAEAEAAEAALGTEGLLLVYREDNDTAGFVHELEVTLPEQSCDNCTLQVLQYMYDDPSAPYYFQCADLVIAADAADAAGAADGGGAPADAGGLTGSGPDSENEPPAASDGEDGIGAVAPAGDSAPGEPRPAPDPVAGGTAGAGATAGGGDATGAPVRGASSESGGCSLPGLPRATSGSALALGLIGLVLARRASRRRR